MDQQQRELDERGCTTLPGLFSAELVRGLRERTEILFAEEGAAAGSEFKQEVGAKRLANLVNKGNLFLEVINHPHVLELVRVVLGEDFKLSSLNARMALPHNGRGQPLHADMGAVEDEFGYWVCNAIWMLTDFTHDNGAIRFVPGSHRWRRRPEATLHDPHVPHPDEETLTGPAGTVVVMNAHLWHGGLPNDTAEPRTAIHAFYCRGDKPQQQYQKQLLDQSLQKQLSLASRRLLALDDPRNDTLSAEATTQSGFLR